MARDGRRITHVCAKTLNDSNVQPRHSSVFDLIPDADTLPVASRAGGYSAAP